MNKNNQKNKKPIAKNKKPYSFLRETFFPACAIFCVAVFIFFLAAMSVGFNVTESKTEIFNHYDNQLGTNQTNSPAPLDALPVQTLMGILLFCIALMTLGQLFKLNYTAITLRLTHFILTVFSFFIFIIVLPGYISTAGVSASILACSAMGVIYFIALGIKLLLLKIKPLHNKNFKKAVAFIMPVFAVFTALVFFISIFNLISQVPIVIKEIEDETFIGTDVVDTLYVRVVTPLAPTVQNYLRYLLTGIIFVLGCAVMKLKLHAVAKWVLNFLILTTGYIGIWIVGMDYFSMVEAHAIPAIIAYLGVYFVTLVTVCIVKVIKRRKTEDTEEYESQFSPGGVAVIPNKKNGK